jgi:hypothetical protein
MSGYVINLANINVTAFRDTAITGIRDNILGVRDIQALQGMLPGWDRSITGTTEPSRIMFKSVQNKTEWVALTGITYNASLCITSAAYQYSNDSTNGTDGTWNDLVDTGVANVQTLTYDGNGDLDSTAWS